MLSCVAVFAWLSCWAAPALGVTPAADDLLASGTAVEAPCSLVDNQTHDELKAWDAETTDPARVQASPSGGTNLTPTGLPYGQPGELAAPIVDPDTLFGPSLQGEATGTPIGCQASAFTTDSSVSGSSVKLYRPGPYTFEQHDFTTDYVLVGDGDPDPTPTVCPENDSHYADPAGNPPSDPPNAHYALQDYCNKVTLTRFFVKGSTGGCPVTADMSQWPTVPYINQYDAGAALGLPVSAGSGGKAGGNACGPSSLLMGLYRQGKRDSEELGGNQFVSPLPSLGNVFDKTMNESRSEAADGDHNFFSGNPKAVAYLKSLGYRNAHTVPLGTDLTDIPDNLTLIHNALANGPALASTAFTTRDWGTAGGGHIIMLAGTDPLRPDEVIVDDPAGNYFSSPYSSYFPNGHYGPGSCGYDVLYPNAWLLAFTTGRWVLPLGHRTQTGAATSSAVTRDATTPNSAFALYDAHPGQPDNPQSFWLQDPEGRRAGYINGSVVSEIPDAAVGQDPPEWTDPGGSDPSIDPTLPEPPPTPRSVVIPNPEAGTTIHIIPGSGGSFALNGDAWVDGSLTASDSIAANGVPGQEQAQSSAALASIEPPPTSSASGGGGSTPAPTGERAGALKKCKRKHTARARKRCLTKAKHLPV